jgi:N-acetyl-S-(2-succino)cysteine monooxygenase
MILTVSASGCGAHPDAWRFSSAPYAPSLAWLRSLTQTAERGFVDAILFDGAWGPAGPFAMDPLPLIAGLASSSKHIGLGAAMALDHAEPFNIARSFAAIDRLTAGRSAFIATMGTERLADFGHAPTLEPAAGFARAIESICVVRKLWDSWEDQAIVLDKPSGRFSDPDYIHAINHVGKYFSVRGPLNAPRPLQGNPPIFQRGGSPGAAALARDSADVFIASVNDSAELTGICKEIGDRPRLLVRLAVLLDSTEAAAQARMAKLGGPLGGLSFVGTPDGLVARLLELSALCDGVDLAPAVMPVDLDLFVDDVAPKLRARGLRPAAYIGATLREHLLLSRPQSQFAT